MDVVTDFTGKENCHNAEKCTIDEKEKVGKLTSQESITECGMDMKL